MEEGSKKSKKSSEKTTIVEIKTIGDRERALERALAGIEKSFGKGSVMKLGDTSRKENVPVVPTGSLGLDVALGVGGLPRGRIIEVFGPESSGKTTVALHSVAEVQKRGGICGYIDAEHALDPVYAKNLGVNIEELYISQPDDGEQALEIAEAMVRSGAIDLVIVDSVAALTPRAEIEGEMGDSHMGLQARLMSQALRKITGIANKTNCTVVFINQLRDKIGGYGGGETTTGGRALKFYASVRIDIRRVEILKVGDNFVGSRTKAKVAKNKVAPPFKSADFDIMYGEGISRVGDILDLGAVTGIVNKSGAWYSFNETRLGQGRDTVKKYLAENEAICREIEDGVRKHFGLPDLDSLDKQIRFLTNDEDVKEAEKPSKAKGKSKKEKAVAKEEEEEITEENAVSEEMVFADEEDLKFEDD